MARQREPGRSRRARALPDCQPEEHRMTRYSASVAVRLTPFDQTHGTGHTEWIGTCQRDFARQTLQDAARSLETIYERWEKVYSTDEEAVTLALIGKAVLGMTVQLTNPGLGEHSTSLQAIEENDLYRIDANVYLNRIEHTDV